MDWDKKQKELIELLIKADSFKISEVKTFEYDDEYGEDYYDHKVNSYEAHLAFKEMLWQAFSALRDKQKDEQTIRELLNQRSNAETELNGLKAKLLNLKASI